MTNQAKFNLVAAAFTQNFISWNPSNMSVQFRCRRNANECRSCILNSSNYSELIFGDCLGSKVLNDTTLASEFFDQYPEYSI